MSISYLAAYRTPSGLVSVPGKYVSLHRAHAAARRAAHADGWINPETVAAECPSLGSAIAVCVAASFFCATVIIGSMVAFGQPDSCRVVVTDSAGQTFIAGEGDSIADAFHGLTLPDDIAEVTFPGCRS